MSIKQTVYCGLAALVLSTASGCATISPKLKLNQNQGQVETDFDGDKKPDLIQTYSPKGVLIMEKYYLNGKKTPDAIFWYDPKTGKQTEMYIDRN